MTGGLVPRGWCYAFARPPWPRRRPSSQSSRRSPTGRSTRMRRWWSSTALDLGRKYDLSQEEIDHRSLVEGGHPDRPGVGEPQPRADHQHGEGRAHQGPGLHQRHLRQRRAVEGERRAAQRRPGEDRPDDLQVHRRRQHRGGVPRRDLPADHDGRPDADPQPALLRGDARSRAVAQPPLRARCCRW